MIPPAPGPGAFAHGPVISSVFIFVAVLAAVALCAPSPAAAVGGGMVFAGNDGRGWDVWQLDGDRLTRVTTQADASAPSLASDGRIAFADAEGSIWLRDVNGALAAVANTPRPCGQPAWSPDGRRLAFACFRFSNRQDDGALWIAKSDGSGAREVYDGPGLQKSPAWSPDGTQLVFVSGFRLTPTRVVEQIWTLDLGTGRAAVLVESDAAAISPAWSPDGLRVAFASDRSGNLDLWLLEISSGRMQQITIHPGADDKPAWSADGSRIAFQSTRGNELEIWEIAVAGGDAVRRVATGGSGLHSARSPAYALSGSSP